jgi:hypothetical protein
MNNPSPVQVPRSFVCKCCGASLTARAIALKIAASANWTTEPLCCETVSFVSTLHKDSHLRLLLLDVALHAHGKALLCSSTSTTHAVWDVATLSVVQHVHGTVCPDEFLHRHTTWHRIPKIGFITAQINATGVVAAILRWHDTIVGQPHITVINGESTLEFLALMNTLR